MKYNYVRETIDCLKDSKNKIGNLDEYLKKLYFVYPTLHVNHDTLGKIINIAHSNFNVPFHHVKVIGSKHQGFSFIDKFKNGKIKYVAPDSDIDLAIIDSNLFNNLVTNTLIKTRCMTDLTYFKTSQLVSYYKKNLANGFIRPDSLGNYTDRKSFESFEKLIKEEFGLKCSIAVYLNETSFILRLEKQLRLFETIKEVNDGIK